MHSPERSLLTSCRTGKKWNKRIKEDANFSLKPASFYSFFPSSTFSQLLSVKAQCLTEWKGNLGEQSYCGLNLIKGRSAFKCPLFPWAKRSQAPLLSLLRPDQTPPLDAINIERIRWPALLSFNNSVRTKVNARNLISVPICFNGVVMQAQGRSNGGGVGHGGGTGRLVVGGGARMEAKLITGLYKFNVMSHFP